MPSARSAFCEGAIAILPVLLGVIPFAAIAGLAATSVNLPQRASSALSVVSRYPMLSCAA
ncbi:MAG: hypothetical protein HC910_11085 [Spirulinaceae cyanobacterium SM2_1_0]|nr:hypothetical protein [Spirulinaceae cyanobacterium SM2_1_0]